MLRAAGLIRRRAHLRGWGLPGDGGGAVVTAGILQHDWAPDAWASPEGTESSQAEAGAAEATRCQGHPDTCQEHKHSSCEAA